MRNNKFIVITTINSPTEGINKYAKIANSKTIVVGDKKTPSRWQQSGTTYLSIKDQRKMEFTIALKLPYNHYSRKMLGYLFAIQQGANSIVDTDDDNIPMANWDEQHMQSDYLVYNGKNRFINVYTHFSDLLIWPRGFPLRQIQDLSSRIKETNLIQEEIKVGIWQGLADRDPDVDAIYRLTLNEPCEFNSNTSLVLGQGNICPFNSQNTAFVSEEMFPLLYLPAFVNFRFTDILRGLVAQPIMWASGYHLGFTGATVVQKRNPHNLFDDFIDEIPCYLHPEEITEIIISTVKTNCSLYDNLFNSYDALEKVNIVQKSELGLLTAWLNDINILIKNR